MDPSSCNNIIKDKATDQAWGYFHLEAFVNPNATLVCVKGNTTTCNNGQVNEMLTYTERVFVNQVKL